MPGTLSPRLPPVLLLLVLLAALSLAACSWQGPSLAGYPGLQWQVQSFYEGRAMEAHALCPNPQIAAITQVQVVEETPERVVMDLRYHWVDDTQTVDMAYGGSKITCQDWGERQFTFARAADGGLVVQSMTGPQK